MTFHAPESRDAAPQARFNHDVEFLQDLIDKLLDVGEAGVKVRQLTRLGKRDGQSNRPLRVVFESETTPRLILSRLWRLKGTKVHIRSDMEPSDRERLKAVTLELKKRTSAGETNLRIVNFRIVTKRVQVNQPLSLQARGVAHSLRSVLPS